MESEAKLTCFHSRECILKHRLRNSGLLASASMCQLSYGWNLTAIRVAASAVIRFCCCRPKQSFEKSWAADDLIRQGSYAEAIAWINVDKLPCRPVAQSESNALIEAITHKHVDSYTRRAGNSISVTGTELFKGSLVNYDVRERFICIQAMMIYNLTTNENGKCAKQQTFIENPQYNISWSWYPQPESLYMYRNTNLVCCYLWWYYTTSDKKAAHNICMLVHIFQFSKHAL